MKFFIIASFIAGSTFAASLNFKAENGTVRFVATGRPALLKIIGTGTGPTGQLTLEKDKINGTLYVDLNSLNTKIDLRDEHMKNKYLEVSKYPRAEIQIIDFPLILSEIKNSSKKIKFSGNMTLHGIKKPVDGEIEISEKLNQINALAQFKIKLTDYLSALPNYAGIKVADETEITVDIKTTVP
jgi:polyisoprenoid-binding protein YceI